MSKKGQEILTEKDIKRQPINHHKVTIIKKNANKISNPRNKSVFSFNRRNKIKINTLENQYLERKSFENELNQNDNSQKENNEIDNNENNNLNAYSNNEDTNDTDENNNYQLDENQVNEKPPNAIEINDLLGERCSIELDILSINFNNYEPSKNSSKTMGLIRAYGANTYQGLIRNYNEDRVSIIINMAKPKNYEKNYWPKTSFFGIYDGHGGSQCSEFLRDSLHKLILNDPNYPENVEQAIKNGFQNAEQTFLENYAINPDDSDNVLDRSGSCAVVILFVDTKIYVANVGDSRALFSENRGKNYVQITEDHKPNNPREKKRIIKNGGQVYQSQTVITGAEKESLNGQILFGPYRVLPGRLSVSRTIGDIEAKNEKFGGNPNVIISVPDIFEYDLKKNKIDFFIMGCDGIFDQMNNDEIIDCAWMILNNKNNNEEKNLDNDSDNIEINFKNYNIHEKCGLIVDFIIKASMVRKSFDNVTCLMIALDDFINNEENISNYLINNESNNISNNENKNTNDIIRTKPKRSSQILNKKRNELIKSGKPKFSDSHLISSNNAIINDINKDISKNVVKENLKLVSFMNSKNNTLNTENHPKSYRNNLSEIKNKTTFNTSANSNIMNQNKIYIRKIKDRNLQKKKTNKTEININNTDSVNSNFSIKKILNKSELQEGRNNYVTNDNKKNSSMDREKNIINKDKLDINKGLNDLTNNTFSSPINSKNNINKSNIIHKIRHNKINKLPLELNNQIINNINNTNKNNINVNFYYNHTGPSNNKLSSINTSSAENTSNSNLNNNHSTSSRISNHNLNFHIKPKKIKNYSKTKAFRYSKKGLSQYRKTFNKNRFYYTSNTHNISDNNSNRRLYSHNYSNNLGIKSANNNNRGSMSSRKKKYSYHQIIKTLSLNRDNMKNKVSQLSNRKLAYSKEKDIHNFLYKNKTNITENHNNENNDDKKGLNKFSKLSLKNEYKKIKKMP